MGTHLTIYADDIPTATRSELRHYERKKRYGQLTVLPARDRTHSTHPAAASLSAFVEATTPWELEEWQRIICERLEKLKHQKGQRLLIHGPPQHGKSILISQRFPCWLLGNDPTHRIRLACYNETHATRFTRTVLNIMRMPIFRDIFPDPACRVPSICAGDEWSTQARGELLDSNPSMKALGMNTGVVGLGADTILIDDPYKGRDQAFSEIVNKGVKDWWDSDIQTRLNPDTNVVVMFHRWTEDDLAGHLLAKGGWELMRFPAIADGGADDPTGRPEGEALSARYPLEYLKKLRRVMNEMFLALYQGSPVAPGGNHFTVGRIGDYGISTGGDFRESASFPLLYVYQGWDLAISKKKAADYTVCATIGVDGDQNLYILDIYREKIDFNDTMEGMAAQYKNWSPALNRESRKRGRVQSVAIETTGYQASAFEEASKRYMIPFVEIKPDKDKLTRSQLLADRVKMGRVYVNKSAAWWTELERELLAFPNGKHDDQVDAIVHALELHPLGVTLSETLPPPEMSVERIAYERAVKRKLERKRTL